jgi:hypothetical protein
MGGQKSMHRTQVTELAISAGTMDRPTANPDLLLQNYPAWLLPDVARPTGRKSDEACKEYISLCGVYASPTRATYRTASAAKPGASAIID